MSVPINRDEKVLIALTHRHKIKKRCSSQATSLHQQAFVSFLQRLDGQLNR